MQLMPPLGVRFGQEVDRAVALSQAGEVVVAMFGHEKVIRSEFRKARLEALYELAYLRVFILWEEFLAAAFHRFLCGYHTTAGRPTLVGTPFRSIVLAEADVLDGHPFVSWAKPAKVEQRSQKYINRGPHELVIASNHARIEWFDYIRNRIAHRSTYSALQFDAASLGLAGRRYSGAAPGRLLRDWDPSQTPAQRWIHSFGAELKGLALQIVPP